MKLWDKVKLYASRKLKIPGFSLIPNLFFNWYQGTNNKQFKVTLPRDPSYEQLRNFARNSIVRIPIEHIEDTISRLRIRIEPVDPNDKNDYSKAIKKIQSIIQKPNAVQTRVAFSKMTTEDLLVVGAGAFEKAFGGDPNRPLYLYPIDSTTLQFVVPYDYQNPDAARYMQLQPDGQHYFSIKEVAYLQKNYFTDRPHGLSPVRQAYDYIRYMLNAGDRADYIASNATADFAMFFKNMDDTKRQELIKYMQEDIEGTGTIPVLTGPDTMETRQIRAINKDQLMLDYQEMLRIIVGLTFKYPPQRMGVIKSGDRATEADLDNYILENCIKPYANVKEDAINEHIIAPLGYEGILKASFMYDDTEAQKAVKSTRVCNEFISGVITRNTALEELDYPTSDSKYADLDIKEATAKMNVDMPSKNGGFNGQGNIKDNSDVKDKKVSDNNGEG